MQSERCLPIRLRWATRKTMVSKTVLWITFFVSLLLCGGVTWVWGYAPLHSSCSTKIVDSQEYTTCHDINFLTNCIHYTINGSVAFDRCYLGQKSTIVQSSPYIAQWQRARTATALNFRLLSFLGRGQQEVLPSFTLPSPCTCFRGCARVQAVRASTASCHPCSLVQLRQ